MASPQTSTWWSTFLDAQGRDSEEEAAFDGYLTMHGMSSEASPEELQQAYMGFRAFMEASQDRGADPGPSRGELAAQQAVAALAQQFVAKSRVAAVGVEKPLTAVTRPAESRQPLAESGVGPEGAAQMAPAEEEPSPLRPQVSGEPPTAPQPHATTTRPDAESHSEGREGRGGRRGGGD